MPAALLKMSGELGGDGAGAVIELAGLYLRLGDQLLHRLHVARRIDDQELHGFRGQRDRGEVREGVVGRGAITDILLMARFCRYCGTWSA